MYALANTGTGIGSILEALIAVAVLRRFAGTWHPFDRARHVVIFLLGSCLAAALVCGAIGTFSLWAAGFVPDHEVKITFVTFFLADAAGIAVFGALVLAWYREPRLDRDIVTSSALIVAVVLADRELRRVEPPPDRLSVPAAPAVGRVSRRSARRDARGGGHHGRHHPGDHLRRRLLRRQDRQRIDPAARRLHGGDHVHRAADRRGPRAAAGSGRGARSPQPDAGAARRGANRRSGREEPAAGREAGAHRRRPEDRAGAPGVHPADRFFRLSGRPGSPPS